MTRQTSSPVYRQIAADIRAAITRGDYPPGSRIPHTELELAQRYNVSRATVRQGLTALVNEGLIYVPARSSGYQVRSINKMVLRPQAEWREQPETPAMDRFMTDHADRKADQAIAVEIVAPPPDVAEQLRLAPGELTVLRRRTRSLDDQPFNINDSYFPYAIAKDSALMDPSDIALGTSEILLEQGFRMDHALDTIEARMPTPEEVERLKISAGIPVMIYRFTGFTADDQPIRHTVNVLPGNLHIVAFERKRNWPNGDGKLEDEA